MKLRFLIIFLYCSSLFALSNKEAIVVCQKRLSCNPGDIETHLKLARLLFKDGQYFESELEFKKVVRRHETSQILLELGNNLYLQGKINEAELIHKRGLVVEPRSTGHRNNLALIYEVQGRKHDSIKLLEELVRLAPKNNDSIVNLSLQYLCVGKLEEGFNGYEYRECGIKELNAFSFGEKLKTKKIKNKRVLLSTEQGIGDVFQFIRYAKKIKDLGAHVILGLHLPFLSKILSLCPYIDEIVLLKDSSCYFDYKVRLMSLPYFFKTSLDSIPNDFSYIKSDKKIENYWSEKLKKDKKFKVGLCWNVSQEKPNEFVYFKSNKRVISFEDLLKISDIDGVSFYSLQKEDQDNIGNGKTIIYGFGENFDKSNGSFMDTAAIMKNLDLVISVDTSTAHLAGALGVPTWILLPFESDWRWLLDRNDSPWYSSVRLFRQTKSKNWDLVLDRVKSELQKKLMKDKK